jgi:hypothetical protein
MPYINIDIDVEDFYDDLTTSEKRDLITFLQEDGMLDVADIVVDSEVVQVATPVDFEWLEMIERINKSRYRLTPEQETMLFNLASTL